MALSKMDLAKEVMAIGGKNPSAPLDKYQQFGSWLGSTDTKLMAKDLVKRGLENGNQLVDDTDRVNTGDASSIRNSQSDWKIAAMQHILANSLRLGIRKPEEMMANKKALISSLDPQYQQALNNPAFDQIHPNWWKVANSILTEQYAKYDSMNANNVAKK